MPTLRYILILLIVSAMCTTVSNAQQPDLARAASGYVANKGQWDANVLYRYAGKNVTLWVTNSGLVYDMRGKQVSTGRKIAQPGKFTPIREEIKDEMVEQHHVVSMDLVGASLTSSVSEQPTGTVLNYFTRNNPANSVVNVPQVTTVRFPDVYPGVSMVMTNPERTPRYDFYVNPGADAKAISMKVNGANGMRVDNDGTLIVSTSCGELRHANVYAYQMIDGKEKPVACKFTAKNNIVSFSLGAYDKSRTLVIDPIVFSSFIGGDENDVVNSIAVHPPSGDIVAVGTTTPTNFPKTTGAYSVQVSSLEDVFVARFKPNLSTAVFISYFGGTATDRAWEVVIGKDTKTPIIVCGETNSSDFPVTSGVVSQTTKGMTDAFVFKMANTGDKLDFSTFFGGSQDDRAYALTVDAGGTIYFAGETSSSNFTTKVGSYRTTSYGGGDGFVTAISPSGGTIVYSTYYGGGVRDRVLDIAASSTNDNSMLITGETRSSDIPLFPVDQVGGGPNPQFRPNPAQSRLNGVGSGAFSDAFIAKFNDLGSSVILSTYAGGNNDDWANAIIVDNAGAATIVGVTSSTDLPALRQIQTKKPGKEIMLVELNTTGRAFTYFSYFGGEGDDEALDLATDGTNLVVVGKTTSNQLPATSNAGQAVSGKNGDGFIAKIAYDNVLYCSYWGEQTADELRCVTSVNDMVSYVGGLTDSPTMTVSDNAFQKIKGGKSDGFMAKYTFSSLSVTTPTATDRHVQVQHSISLGFASDFQNTDAFTIEYSSNEGATWNVVRADLKARSFIWTLPTTLTAGDKYKIRVVHVNTGLTASNTGLFTVRRGAAVSSMSKDTTLCNGLPLTLQVSATGSDLTYAWRLNNNPISGATMASYTIPMTKESDAGSYTVSIGSSCNVTVVSPATVVGINPPPVITQEPTELRVAIAATAIFNVTATGKNLKYVWQRNKSNLAGVANAPQLSLTNAQKFDEGMYRCIVTGDCGADTSAEVNLFVGDVSVPFEVSESGNLSISMLAPNPASSDVSIVFTNRTNESVRVTIVDALGNQVFQTMATDERLGFNIANLANGTYRLVMRAGADVCYKPFVVIK